MNSITVRELKEYSKSDYLLIDIRSSLAYENGHILDAISFPEPFDLEQLIEIIHISGKKKTIIYCTMGERSREYVSQLYDAGYEAYNLHRGYKEWLLQGEDYLSDEEMSRYSRQMILPEFGSRGQRKLKSAKVLVVGAGALGTVALTYLATAGVGYIGIAEADTIESSNLHRQILYGKSDIGKSKNTVAKTKLQEMNPYISVNQHETFLTPRNITEIIRGYDFVIDATDRIETKFLINDACVLDGIAFCHAGVVGFEGQVMTWKEGGYPCYRCIFEDVPQGYIPNCAEAGIIGAMSGVIGSIQALEAIKYVTGIGELLLGKIYHLDGLTMKSRIVFIHKKSEACMVCGKNRTINDVSQCEEKYRHKECSI